MDVSTLTIKEAGDQLASGELTAEALTKSYLDRIKEQDSDIHAFLSVSDTAVSEAIEIDRRRAAGESLGPLAGIPVGTKDVIVVKGWETTGGSQILEGYRAPYDATAIERLRKAGAILIGRTNCDEFAMGSSNENSHYGPVKIRI